MAQLDIWPCGGTVDFMPRFFVFLLALLAAPATGADSHATFDPNVIDVTYGAFCRQDTVGAVPAPDTAAEKVDLLPNTPEIRWVTHRIPALPGISFGIRTRAVDNLRYDPVLIELTHPPFVGSGLTRQSYLTALGGEGASINAYSFDTVEELVTGTWVFRALHNGQELYRVQFQVVPPELAPDVGRDCGADIIS